MAQVLEYLVRQQALPPTPASGPPPAPAPLPSPPVLVVNDTLDRDETMSEGDQDVISIAGSWDGDSLEQQETEVQETDVTPLSSLVRALMERASNLLKVPWKAAPEQSCSVFRPMQASTPQHFLVFPDFLEEVQSSWH